MKLRGLMEDRRMRRVGAKSGRAVVGRGASCPEKGCESEGRCSFRFSTPHGLGEAVEPCCWRLRGLGTSKNPAGSWEPPFYARVW